MGKPEVFLRTARRRGHKFSSVLYNTVFEVLARAIIKKKEGIGIQVWNEEFKLPSFTDDMILHTQKLKTKNLLELRNNAAKSNTMKSIYKDNKSSEKNNKAIPSPIATKHQNTQQ